MFNIDENGIITLVQGDSGEINITGIPTDKNYKVSFAVQDENRTAVGGEVTVNTNGSDKVKLSLLGNYTDKFTVPKGEETANYNYGVKLWTTDGLYEDTSIIASSYKGKIIVYPKIVEGYNE